MDLLVPLCVIGHAMLELAPVLAKLGLALTRPASQPHTPTHRKMAFGRRLERDIVLRAGHTSLHLLQLIFARISPLLELALSGGLQATFSTLDTHPSA